MKHAVVSPAQAIMAYGRWRYNSTHSYPWHYMQAGGYLQHPDSFNPSLPPRPNDTNWGPQSRKNLFFWRRKNLFPLPTVELQTVQPDYATQDQ